MFATDEEKNLAAARADAKRLQRKNRMWILFSARNGRRAFYAGRSQSESAGGLHRSENAGMSSANYVRIIMAESLRFLKEGSSASR